MNNFQRITASREALAAFLGTIPAIETPWDDAFHRIYCSSCSAADCDDCRRPERDTAMVARPPGGGGREMIVICREVSKNSGEIAVYPIKAPATERLLFQLQIRSRVNPELRYFVVALARWENEELRKQIERLLRRKDVTQRAIDALGGMVEL